MTQRDLDLRVYGSEAAAKLQASWHRYLRQLDPSYPAPSPQRKSQHQRIFDDLLSREIASEDELTELIAWLAGDSAGARFWAPHVQSPAQLRAHDPQTRQPRARRLIIIMRAEKRRNAPRKRIAKQATERRREAHEASAIRPADDGWRRGR